MSSLEATPPLHETKALQHLAYDHNTNTVCIAVGNSVSLYA